ncbi:MULTISPECIES: LPP20 family lipoprotein [unclassified Thermosipho (in: thermotogales)]|uniref:LPP20 family lipoprotein n=1 Tax=unclassified Thermosipho (in: thermotogales) TaxID=2676525 RepID=UPI00098764A0|nr:MULTISPECIES: LPP20 family lipoprotein [unclassified Thermosipho (in: thermotogales)]MBT1247290.1 hypothetical protein [Thermosipho sp. 1244]OOC47145.1 hypothetical protein XO09_03005 [Thermosipho sp. 1223]
MKKITYIMLLILAFFLFSCNNTESKTTTNNDFSIPYGFIGAFGEGISDSEGKSEEIARKEALRKISEQIFVEVKSNSTLYENLVQITDDEKVKEQIETKLESVIQTNVSIELVNVDFTLVDKRYENGKYYTKVLGLLDKDTALNIYKVYFAIKLGQSLLKDKMIYSAQRIVKEYEILLSQNKTQIPANMFSSLTQIVSEIKIKWEKVNELYRQLSQKEIKNTNEALKLLEGIDKIKEFSKDFPENKLISLRKKAQPFLKDVVLKIEGPDKVSVGMRIDLTVKLTPNIDDIVLKVTSKNGDFPKNISLKNGKAILSGVVKNKNIEVEISLGGVISKKYAPGTTQGTGISSQETGKLLRISAEGAGSTREKAIEKALILAVKKAMGMLFANDVNLLLSLPVDAELIDSLIGVLQYEIVNEDTKNEVYHVVINVSFEKDKFKDLVKKIINNKPLGYAVLVVNNDQYGYIEPYIEQRLINSGIKLVSKEYSKNLVGYKDPNLLSKLALLSAAKYVINVKVSYGEKYLQDYELWSVRLLLNVQLIDTFSGQIIKSLTFEDTGTGATKQSALSKVLNKEKFVNFMNNLVGNLRKEEDLAENKVKLIFNVSRSTYVLVLKDYLNEMFKKVNLIERTPKRGVFVIETSENLELIIKKVKNIPNLNINVLEIKDKEVVFNIK